ncbi:penicillin acylase family protein [Streptomyces caniscabiei]|uniref:Penicillin acylase family protein n=1 Tax=Streptomyces caniscabiei TaxID=2746961 RepID=A0A927LCN6_9ACTN|nr:penicillin acylase family protein [Streptomyces caniscabiei]MBD9729952.1 penicillin acylase family protein [Streptomyces caniscabiei]MDX3508198.1 penicillin acylase family protein [Streptomyces caniscabiei]MDX3718160.1 penicillin acylase family protein [Streptomyces caniscabiei]WEO25868.1 penicillin acylase family protein [Streptomyces caniscabiei]
MRDIDGARGRARGSDSRHAEYGIFRDAWGIPHLRAADARALAHTQGRVTALDRAWQLEVERHRVQGTSAAFLGEDSLGWDRFARRTRLEDTARRCFARLESTDPESADWVRAYVEGVNDGLVAGGRRAPEFGRVGLAPGRWEAWHPLGVWLATHILFAGFPAKLWREEAVRHLGADVIGLFATDGPATSGSNGWLVDGSRTTTGQAVIAGDPHRFIEEPGVYQQIHLSCPEFDVVGLAVPGMPGIAHFGHTGDVAWAITNAMADYQDLYRERLRYRAGDGEGNGDGHGDEHGHGGVVEALDPDGVWRAVHRHVEVIEVAGGEPVEVEVIETARGPVVIGGLDSAAQADDDAPVGPLSLRYPPRVTEDLGIGALLPLLRARDVADVDRAFDRWAEPVNVVQAADTRGGVLHRVAGRVPVRSRDNRTRVVAAWEPGHEWEGWHETPYGSFEDGVAVMANQRGPATPLGVEFAPPHRAERIRALLDQKRVWSAADMPTIHMDTHLASAGPLLEMLAAVALRGPEGGSKPLTPAAAALCERLSRWDRRMEADSVDAAEYAALRGAVVRRLAAEPAFAALAVPPAYPEVFRPWLSLTVRIGFALEHLLRVEELYGIDRVAVVREALEEVAGRESGRWGDSHRLVPWRALPDAGTDPGTGDGTGNGTGDGTDEGPGDGSDGRPHLAPEPGLAGDHDCVLCTSAVPGITDLSARGPAARYVWDLARREDSLWVVPFGASGVGGAAHHRDQLPLWLRGDLVPVVTDWDRFTKDDDTDRSSSEEKRHDR